MSGSDIPPTAALLAAAGMEAAEPVVRRLPGGANNRVFEVRTAGARALLKAYFSHPDDRRDRLGAEFGFSTYAWEAGVRALPRPLASDPVARLGLYEFIEGDPIDARPLGAEEVAAAARFVREVNRSREHATRLPSASEARFSIEEHLETIRQRVARLGELDVQDRRLPAVLERIAAAWETATEVALGAVIDPAAELAPEERIVSPSDFGFHNAIRRPDRSLCFIDFEYAGWDDPAKLVCDFFSQVAVPVPLGHFDAFTEEALAFVPDPERARERAVALLPAYRVKWACIVLNQFHPTDRRRRDFAGAEGPSFDAERQIAKALACIDHLPLPG